VAGVDIQDIAGRFRREVRGEPGHSLGHVLWEDAELEQAALAIDRFQVVGRGLVLLGALVAPLALPNDATLTPSIQYGYVGDQWTTVFQKDPADAANHLAQRNLVNAQLTYDAGPYEVAAYVTNLGDLHYVAAANVGLFYAGAPRQFGVRLKRSF
jgi:hypothetical protein